LSVWSKKTGPTIDAEKTQAIAEKLRNGAFDLEDLGNQLKQISRQREAVVCAARAIDMTGQ
jgi:signal recognition particle GTPase